MRTNVVLDEAKLAELVRLTGARSKTAAVARALDEQIRREKLRRLGELLGGVDVDEEAIAALRQVESDELPAGKGTGSRGRRG